jgi:DNA-binding XRE family transcriptional regulator
MSATLSLQRQQTEDYARIVDARFADDRLFIIFADGEEVQLPVEHFENPRIREQHPDWGNVRPGPHEILVPTADGDLGIPWDTIRALTDPKFSVRWAEMANLASDTLGQGVRRLRTARGLSHDELARWVNVPLDTIERLEAGTLPADLVFAARVLQAMDCTLDDLSASR